MTKAQAALRLPRSIGAQIPIAKQSPFNDVSLMDFAADAIIELYNRGDTEDCDSNGITLPARFGANEGLTESGFARLMAKVFDLVVR